METYIAIVLTHGAKLTLDITDYVKEKQISHCSPEYIKKHYNANTQFYCVEVWIEEDGCINEIGDIL